MATQITRINPLDLQGNIAIGVALPFDQPGVFKSTYSTQDQIKSNLVNLILTNKGERLFNPEFGADVKRALFEQKTSNLYDLIRNNIISNVNFFIPEIIIPKFLDNLNTPGISIEEFPDTNSLSITINYKLKVSGKSDQVTVEFI